MRIGLVATAICLSVVGLAAAGAAAAAIRKDTSIPAGGLGPALQSLAKQYDFQVLYRTEVVGSLHTGGAVGQFTSEEALKQLLKGTGLTYRHLDEKTITIMPAGVGSAGAGGAPASPGASPPTTMTPRQWESGGTSSGAPLLAQATLGQSGGISSTEVQKKRSDDLETPLQEVIVTAQKKNERLQDVPVPVAVVQTADLVEFNEVRLQDYYSRIPGLSVVGGSSSSSYQTVAIRGITTGSGTTPTVGVTIDDVPYGSSTANGGGNLFPDLDPSDFARIEVLRGPQGTLYGASSLGGLIKYVTIDPSTDAFTGRVEAGTLAVYNGNGPGFDARAAVNIPISQTVALRASGFTREDPGYIDNPVLNIDGINQSHVSGGRLAGIWTPNESLTLKASAIYQHFTADGVNDVDGGNLLPGYAGLGDLQQNYARGIGGSSGTVQAYSVALAAKIGGVNFTSLSGYNIRDSVTSVDYSYLFSSFAAIYGQSTTPFITDNQVKKFTQEMRLSSTLGAVDWLLGAFYTHEKALLSEDIQVSDSSGQVVASPYDTQYPQTYSEYAVFGDLTLHFGERFDIQLGGRGSRIDQSFQEYDLIFGAASNGPLEESRGTPFTYLVTPRFSISEDLMLYARLASGYRAGGPNLPSGPTGCVALQYPCGYAPDKTQNYEVGIKGDFLDKRLSVDGSVYYIDWKDIQLFVVLPPPASVGYTTNASAAKSQGVELSLEARPFSGFTLSAWGVWDDAELTKAFPAGAAYGVPGDRLTYSSKFSGSFSAEEQFPLTQRLSAFLGASVTYVGDRLGAFSGSVSAPAPRQDLPAYGQTDLHTGLRGESWTVNLFVSNAFDKRGLLDGGTDLFPPAYLYTRPRTVGVNFTKTF